MSRVGKQPIEMPQGAKAQLQGQMVHIEGPLGKMQYRVRDGVSVTQEDGKLVVSIKEGGLRAAARQLAADFGTTRAHLNNMVKGVTKGWKRSLELNGVGFNAKAQGQKLVLNVGFSHEVVLEIPQAVKCVITKNTIDLDSYDKEVLGTFASNIRRIQPPEPYLGKGIKYSDEVVRRKAGKTGKK